VSGGNIGPAGGHHLPLTSFTYQVGLIKDRDSHGGTKIKIAPFKEAAFHQDLPGRCWMLSRSAFVRQLPGPAADGPPGFDRYGRRDPTDSLSQHLGGPAT
jgi:hypothetical protein